MKKVSVPKHLLTGEEFTKGEIYQLLDSATELKQQRKVGFLRDDLKGQHLALLFDKPSLRTRFSFSVAMRELGGDVIESIGDTRKNEDPKDQARVLHGYCQGMMMRTHSDHILFEMSCVSKVPIINGLSDLHHPCQIFSDLFTLKECFGDLSRLTLSYIGDGNNILHSLLLLLPQMGIRLRYCCPKQRQPNFTILKKAIKRANNSNDIVSLEMPSEAAEGAHAVYTDVWTSMGFENQVQDQEVLFAGFQVNEKLMACARSEAVFMHCLPMERGKEVSETLPDQSYSVIFQQSENRLHMQKALLIYLMKECSQN